MYYLCNVCLIQARAGKLSTDEVLRVCEAFRHEKSLIVWQDLISNLRYIGILLQERKGDASELEALKRYTKELLIPIVELLGWEPKAGERARHLAICSRIVLVFVNQTQLQNVLVVVMHN